MVIAKLETPSEFMEKRIEGISLALFFIWIGISWIFNFHQSVSLIGIAVIIFGAQVARILTGSKLQGFWLFVGVVFLLSGLVHLLKTRIDLVPIFFIAIGILMLMRHINVFKKRK